MTELTHTDPLGCPGSGRLRTHLDHPDGAVEAHLDGCEECRDTILTIADDAGTVRRLVAVLDSPAGLDSPAVDAPTAASGRPSRAPVGAIGASVAPGRGRPRSRRSSRPGSRADTGRHAGRTRPRRVVLAVAGGLLTVAIAVTPFGSGALAQFLDTFRSERVQVIEVDVAALQDLDALDDIATVELTGDGALHDGPTEVADAAAALAIAGVAAPDLPAGVAGPDATVTHLAIAPSHAVVTLVATADNGVPADLDGAVLDEQIADDAARVRHGRRGPLRRRRAHERVLVLDPVEEVHVPQAVVRRGELHGQRPVVVAPAVDAHVHPERRRADFPGDVPEEPAVDVVLRVGRGLVGPREHDGVPRPRQPELEPVAGPERDQEREDVRVADPEEAQRPVRRVGGREADVAVAP